MTRSRRSKPESLLKRFGDPFESPLARPQAGIALLAARRQVETATLAAREAMLQSQAAGHAKANFLTNMSHELRAPLHAIVGFSELIEPDGAQARERHLALRLPGERIGPPLAAVAG
jgi:signal transduction histidine kinase